MLPPGRARLLTIPASARSLDVATTTGTVVVASRAWRAAVSPATTSTAGDSATLSRISARTRAGSIAIPNVDLDRSSLDLSCLAHALEEAFRERASTLPHRATKDHHDAGGCVAVWATAEMRPLEARTRARKATESDRSITGSPSRRRGVQPWYAIAGIERRQPVAAHGLGFNRSMQQLAEIVQRAFRSVASSSAVR